MGLSKLVRFSELSPPRRALIRLCQHLNFGQIQGLRVQDADPVLNPPPVVIADVKLDADDTRRQELELKDFTLRREACRLMDHLDELNDGTILRIDVRAGNPSRILFESSLPETLL
jgi:hypothetical protein